MTKSRNFLLEQYQCDSSLSVRHTYLQEQFSDYRSIFEDIAAVIEAGDYTLGRMVDVLERELCEYLEVENVVSVGSGTDAIYLSLRAIGIGHGDQVLVPSYTFYATAGAVVKTGATPVFCDVGLDGNVRVEDLERALLHAAQCKAIVPVHWTGRPVDINGITNFSENHEIGVVYDACHAIGAHIRGSSIASKGDTSAFSFHPLKNLNVWGDGGFIATEDADLATKLRILRNHGLVDREKCVEFGVNSRLDTVQAVVASHLLKKLPDITAARINNAMYLDQRLKDISELQLSVRDPTIKEVFHLYSFRANRRDDLAKYLREKGIDAKVHYPIPLHKQPAAERYLVAGMDYSNSEELAAKTVSLPVHEFVTEQQLSEMVQLIKKFYAN
jgi:dTDP-4-amino-4,6-dideoxygalactose transaminase